VWAKVDEILLIYHGCSGAIELVKLLALITDWMVFVCITWNVLSYTYFLLVQR